MLTRDCTRVGLAGVVSIVLMMSGCSATRGADQGATTSIEATHESSPTVDAPGVDPGEEEGFAFNVDPFGPGEPEVASEAALLELANKALEGTGITVTFLPPSAAGGEYQYFWRNNAFVAVGKDLTIIEGSGHLDIADAVAESVDDFRCSISDGAGAAQLVCSSETTILKVFVPDGADAREQLLRVRDSLIAKRVELGEKGNAQPAAQVAFDAPTVVDGSGSLKDNPLGTSAVSFGSSSEALAAVSEQYRAVGGQAFGFDPSALGDFSYFLGSSSLAATSDQLLVVESIGEITSTYAQEWVAQVNSSATGTATAELLDSAKFERVCVALNGAQRVALVCGADGVTISLVSSGHDVSILSDEMETLLRARVQLG